MSCSMASATNCVDKVGLGSLIKSFLLPSMVFISAYLVTFQNGSKPSGLRHFNGSFSRNQANWSCIHFSFPQFEGETIALSISGDVVRTCMATTNFLPQPIVSVHRIKPNRPSYSGSLSNLLLVCRAMLEEMPSENQNKNDKAQETGKSSIE